MELQIIFGFVMWMLGTELLMDEEDGTPSLAERGMARTYEFIGKQAVNYWLYILGKKYQVPRKMGKNKTKKEYKKFWGSGKNDRIDL